MASLSAFNRCLDDDWGYSYQDRLFAAPMLSLADPDAAVDEVERLLERGVRMVHVRPAPVPGPNGTSRSLGDKRHDPVWARLAEASVPVAFHLGDSGYNGRIAAAWGAQRHVRLRQERPAGCSLGFRSSDPRHDGVADHSRCLRSRTRRCASRASRTAPTGCTFWPSDCASRPTRRRGCSGRPASTPCATHVWVTPYLEEDLQALADLIGVERILFGSDWPHGEGVAQPLDFMKELDGFDEPACARIMRDNCLELLGTAPA